MRFVLNVCVYQALLDAEGTHLKDDSQPPKGGGQSPTTCNGDYGRHAFQIQWKHRGRKQEPP